MPRRNSNTSLKNGILFGAIAAVVSVLPIAAILIFGFQDGLPITDRCHCSWEKVIVFSILAFAAVALQTAGYLYYWNQEKEHLTTHNTRKKSAWNNGKGTKLLILVSLITILVPLVIIFLGVPLLVDQNMNFLWFFQSGMGILCVIVTFLTTAIASFLQKIIFRY